MLETLSMLMEGIADPCRREDDCHNLTTRDRGATLACCAQYKLNKTFRVVCVNSMSHHLKCYSSKNVILLIKVSNQSANRSINHASP